jgi:hypothetical protein
MNAEIEHDKSFPYFEEHNFSGWLIQFKAMLRELDCDEVIETPIPKDVDAAGNPIPMNARERQDFNRELRAYKELDKIAYARIMKACRLNPKTKNLCETGNFKTANEILVRLRQRFHTMDDMVKASHLLRYSSLKQNEGESGADFVDREQKQFQALQEMGINMDDSLRLTKFIQQDTANSKHKSLAQTIFTTPNMTLSRATSLFETYHPESSSSTPEPSVNALFCRYCKKKGHAIQSCTKRTKSTQKNQRKSHPDEKPLQNGRSPCAPRDSRELDDNFEDDSDNASDSSDSLSESGDERPTKKRSYLCALCDLCDHPSHRCPRLPAVRQYLRESNSHP